MCLYHLTTDQPWTYFKWSIWGGCQFGELEYHYDGDCMGNHLKPKYSDHYRGVVDLWRWSVTEVLYKILGRK